VGGVADADFVCRGADFAVSGPLPGRLALPECGVVVLAWPVSRHGVCLGLGSWWPCEWSVVDGLTEVDLPWFGSAACGVPGVEADEVVADECDGHEQGGRDEPGLSEEAAVDAQPLVAVGADESFDEGAPVERQGPARRLP